MQDNLKDFFEIKSNIAELNNKLNDSLAVLSHDFENYFYFKITSTPQVRMGDAGNNLSFAFYIPSIRDNNKLLMEIDFHSFLNLGKIKDLQLVGFENFSLTVKNYKINDKLACLIMHPDLDVQSLDLPDYLNRIKEASNRPPMPIENIVRASLTKINPIEKHSINNLTFNQFCKKMQKEKIIPFIETHSFFSNAEIPEYKLNKQMQTLLTIKICVNINNLCTSILRNEKYEGLDSPEHEILIKTLDALEKRKMFNNLNNNLPPKPQDKMKTKI